MVPERGIGPEAAALASVFEAKVRAELDAADALLGVTPAIGRRGEPGSSVLLVKGTPGPEDVAAGVALAGADGTAALAALGALGIPAEDALGICSRPTEAASPEARARRVARYMAASDPELVIALDAQAAEDVGAAIAATLAFGEPVAWHGRTLLAVDGLEASLADEKRKAAVWRQFKGLSARQGRFI